LYVLLKLHVLMCYVLDVVGGGVGGWIAVASCFGALVCIVLVMSFLCWKRYCREVKVCRLWHCDNGCIFTVYTCTCRFSALNRRSECPTEFQACYYMVSIRDPFGWIEWLIVTALSILLCEYPFRLGCQQPCRRLSK